MPLDEVIPVRLGRTRHLARVQEQGRSAAGVRVLIKAEPEVLPYLEGYTLASRATGEVLTLTALRPIRPPADDTALPGPALLAAGLALPACGLTSGLPAGGSEGFA